MSKSSLEDPPLKNERQLCYNSRDNYWNCLDKNSPSSNSSTPTSNNSSSGGTGFPNSAPDLEQKEQVPSACQELRRLYESYCSARWVEHFDRKYRFERWKGQELKQTSK